VQLHRIPHNYVVVGAWVEVQLRRSARLLLDVCQLKKSGFVEGNANIIAGGSHRVRNRWRQIDRSPGSVWL